MSHCINTAVNRVEAPGRRALRDATAREADRVELSGGDYPVLIRG
jgi:hypothetical protein